MKVDVLPLQGHGFAQTEPRPDLEQDKRVMGWKMLLTRIQESSHLWGCLSAMLGRPGGNLMTMRPRFVPSLLLGLFLNLVPAVATAQLDALGFVWDPLQQQWDEGVAALQAYHTEKGDCRVPTSYTTPTGYKLGSWVSERRKKKASLPPDRIARLEALGFVWDARQR